MYGLIPLPAELIERHGSLKLGSIAEAAAPAGLEAEAAVLNAWLARAKAAAGVASAEGANRDGGADRSDGAIAPLGLSLDAALGGPEAYRLSISSDGVSIAAASPAGLVRAGATLYQLALSHPDALPCVEIRDEPRFAWRGFMIDAARSFYRVEFLERLIDLAAMHKLNVFHWHLSDDQAWRLELPGLPELAAMGSRRLDRRFNAVRYRTGSYSPEDVRRIVAYAAARHIEVIPEIDVPGHSTALLASHPELWCHGDHSDRLFQPEDRFGVFDGILCAGNEETFGLLDRVLDGLAEFFPSGYVHAGGDEVPKGAWLSCDRCRARMAAEGLRDEAGALDPERLQAYFMDRVSRSIAARDRRMIGWDEVVDGSCGKDVLVMAWRSHEHGYRAARAGYDVVMCPQTKACYLDHKHLDEIEEPGQLGVCTVRDAYAFDPAPADLEPALRARIRGGQANLWGELMYFGRQAEYMLYPRLSAIAEALWSPADRKDFASFERRLEVHGGRLDLLGVNRYRGALG